MYNMGNCITFHFLSVGKSCSYFQFRCLDLSSCISLWGVCNGYKDCPDGSDESYSVCGKC